MSQHIVGTQTVHAICASEGMALKLLEAMKTLRNCYSGTIKFKFDADTSKLSVYIPRHETRMVKLLHIPQNMQEKQPGLYLADDPHNGSLSMKPQHMYCIEGPHQIYSLAIKVRDDQLLMLAKSIIATWVIKGEHQITLASGRYSCRPWGAFLNQPPKWALRRGSVPLDPRDPSLGGRRRSGFSPCLGGW